jgi:MFS family permease
MNIEPEKSSALDPLRSKVFRILWLATIVANIGTWMQNAAAGWLMTGLTKDPFVVSLIQVATTLPVVLFGLPAGALSDIVDRRKLLISVNTALAVIVAVLGALVLLDQINPTTLIAFTFLAGSAAALIMPSWQAIVPILVPRHDLQAAISLNSVGINISRAIGPALAGLLIGIWGLASPFLVNAVTTLGVVSALLWWRTKPESNRPLPPEQFVPALVVGLRHANYNPHLRATLMRAAGFFLFASAYWALLPLVARNQVAGGPQLYGILLGTIGFGAVLGAFLLPQLTRKLSPDKIVTIATIGTAAALVLFAVATSAPVALVASFLAGLCWIAALAPLNVSAQVGLPAWVKGRGLSLYVTVQFGGMALGSVLWGQVAKHAGLPIAHIAAATCALIAIPLVARWKLSTGALSDLTPSMHWPAPLVGSEIHADQGPVLVTVEYLIDPKDRNEFLSALADVRAERLRDGAYDWDIFEDAADSSRMLETFLVPSWIEHQRQHQRVTKADHLAQEKVSKFHRGTVAPVVHHLVAARSSNTPAFAGANSDRKK